MEAMQNNYQKLLDAGFDPEKFKKGNMNEQEKNKVKRHILKNMVKDDPKYFRKRTVRDIHLGKWEHAVRICCSGEKKYYVGEVATSFRPTIVWANEVPGCDGKDKIVMYIHSHTDKSPNFSGPDERTANRGFKFPKDPQREIPAGTSIMASAVDGKGDILTYEYNPRATQPEERFNAYKNYKKIR